MNIVTYCFGEIDPKLISVWVSAYQKSETDIPAILLFKNISPELLSVWPYTKIEIPNDISVDIPIYNPSWKANLFCDVMKMLAVRLCGPCILMDIDAIIRKKITKNILPECNWGIVKKRNNKSYCFCEFAEPELFTCFDEFSFVEDCFAGLQIMKEDKFDLFYSFFIKYLSRIHELKFPAIYGEAIISLTHKFSNGTYLQPEWDWMFDTRNINSDVIVEHFCSPFGKSMLLHKTYTPPTFKFFTKKKA